MMIRLVEKGATLTWALDFPVTLEARRSPLLLLVPRWPWLLLLWLLLLRSLMLPLLLLLLVLVLVLLG
jgi:hypothetical protein